MGYAGPAPASERILDALERLSYRGYDGAGLALARASGLAVAKTVGEAASLRGALDLGGTVGIGHTRWATHGDVSARNAHPHLDCGGRFAVVHNGVFENARAVRAALEARGHRFASGTDTEVLAHLLEDSAERDLVTALRRALAQLEGSWAVAVVAASEPDAVAIARRRSPLVVGLAPGVSMAVSDALALPAGSWQVAHLDEGDVGLLREGTLALVGADGRPKAPRLDAYVARPLVTATDRHEHHMRREIGETPAALARLLDALEGKRFPVAQAERVVILACGTSLHAGLVARHAFEELAGIPTSVHVASEYRYAEPLHERGTLAIGVSQSGETADTIEALRVAQASGLPTLAVTNGAASTLTRLSAQAIALDAGPEVSVAATKTFVTTLGALYALALDAGRARGRLATADERHLRHALRSTPRAIARVVAREARLDALARAHLAPSSTVFCLGRRLGHGLAAEAALKLKEVAYVHAEAYSAGELKHGPLALVEPGVPILATVARDRAHAVMLSNVSEAQARGGVALLLGDEGDVEAEATADAWFGLPRLPPLIQPFPAAAALHLLAYHAARAKGAPIDRPRNLAKSVTVE